MKRMSNFEEIHQARRLLDLGEAATLEEIKSAYRTLARRHHPDAHIGTSENGSEKMRRLNQAYKVLTDYCHDYKYSFRKEDVARTYPIEEDLETWRNRWFDSI